MNDDQEDVVAQAIAEANAPTCPVCRRLVMLTETGMVKVHFAKNTDTRPCPSSFKPWAG